MVTHIHLLIIISNDNPCSDSYATSIAKRGSEFSSVYDRDVILLVAQSKATQPSLEKIKGV